MVERHGKIIQRACLHRSNNAVRVHHFRHRDNRQPDPTRRKIIDQRTNTPGFHIIADQQDPVARRPVAQFVYIGIDFCVMPYRKSGGGKFRPVAAGRINDMDELFVLHGQFVTCKEQGCTQHYHRYRVTT